MEVKEAMEILEHEIHLSYCDRYGIKALLERQDYDLTSLKSRVVELEQENAELLGVIQTAKRAFNNEIELKLLPSEAYDNVAKELSQLCWDALRKGRSD